MENFVSVILKTKELDENAIVEAMLDSLDAPLAERVTDYGLFESEKDTVVLRMPTPYALEEDECETFTQAFADKMFEMGYDDFDVEISLDERKGGGAGVLPRPKGVAGNAWDRKHGKTHNPDGTPKKAPQPAPQAQTTAPKMGKSDTTSGKPPKVAGVQSNGKLTNYNIDKSLPSVDVKNIRTGENFRVYGPPANVEKLISRPDIEKVYSGRGDAGARQELELRKQQMKTGPDGAYDGDDLGNAPTAPKEIKVTLSNYADMIKRAKELAAKAKQGPDGAYDGDDLGNAPTSSGPTTRGKAGGRKDSASPEKTSPKANSAVNTQASAPTQMMASMYSESVLLEELTDAEKKEYEAIVKGLEDLLASPDIDPPVRSEIDKTLADLKPDRNDPRKAGDDSSNANQTAADNAMGREEKEKAKETAPKFDKEGALLKFARSKKGGLANDPDEVEAITELQTALKQLGFNIEADGKYGPNTIAAVKEFQEIMGLEVDGDAGPETIGQISTANTIPGLVEFYRDLKRMAQLITKANEGIVFETKLYEALTAEEQEEFDALYTKHKAKFEDGEYMSALPKSLTDKMGIVSKHKLGAGANTPEEKAEAEKQVKAQEEKAEAVSRAQKLIDDAKDKHGSSGDQLDKYLIMLVAQQVRKREYIIALEILNASPSLKAAVSTTTYIAIMDKANAKSFAMDDPTSDTEKKDKPKSTAGQSSSSTDGGATDPDAQSSKKGVTRGQADALAGRGDYAQDNVELAKKSIDERVDILYKAMKGGIFGIGTDEDSVADVIATIKNETEWNQLQQKYKDKHDDLLTDLRDELSEADFKKYVQDYLSDIGIDVPYEPAEDDEEVTSTDDKSRDATATYTGNFKEDYMTYLGTSLSEEETKEFIDAQDLDGKDIEELGEMETSVTRLMAITGGSQRNPVRPEMSLNDQRNRKSANLLKQFKREIEQKQANPTEKEPEDTSAADNQAAADAAQGNTSTDFSDASDALRDAMRGAGTDEDGIAEELAKVKSPEDWQTLQDEYETAHDRNLLDDLRSELNRGDFKEYVADVLQDVLDKTIPYKPANESISEMRGAGFFEETYEDDDEFYEMYGELGIPEDEIWEADYRGRKVKLNKPMRGDVKKFKVYVKNNKGNVIKVNFGDPNSKIKKSNPARRRSFRARHNCDNPGPKTKARYWSCRKW